MIITRQMYLKGRQIKFASEFTPELSDNTDKIIAKASELLSRYETATGDSSKGEVASGWRPKEINAATPGASPTSTHIYCAAVDLVDWDKKLGNWLVENVEVLVEIGLFMESLLSTHVGGRPWVHVSFISPKSGNRIFIP